MNSPKPGVSYWSTIPLIVASSLMVAFASWFAFQFGQVTSFDYFPAICGSSVASGPRTSAEIQKSEHRSWRLAVVTGSLSLGIGASLTLSALAARERVRRLLVGAAAAGVSAIALVPFAPWAAALALTSIALPMADFFNRSRRRLDRLGLSILVSAFASVVISAFAVDREIFLFVAVLTWTLHLPYLVTWQVVPIPHAPDVKHAAIIA